MIKDPSRLAWTVLIISLIAFCITSTAIFLGVRWFLFDSTMPMNVTLSVGRGTVGVRAGTGDAAEEVERATRILSRDDRLTTDSSSQGYITFTDPYSHEVIASLTLHRDSTIVLGSASRPRFDFSSGAYIITIADSQGQFDIDIFPNLNRGIRFDVQSALGLIRMGSRGNYLLTSQEDAFTVFNRSGEAVVINQDSQARSVPEGMQGSITKDASDIVLEQPFEDILPDGGFDTINSANPSLSTAWRCYTQTDDPNSPEGAYGREIINDRSVMHITRLEQPGKPANNHAETGCLQYLNTAHEGLPITQYNYLELRASMLIQYQSLSACGQAGSECPLMLVIDYIDPFGQNLRWIHGFYARYDPAVGWPLRCASCALDHERLNPNTWYTFTSGNLLQLLPEAQRPTAILDVHFYASGHEYDVLLSEVALLAGNTPETDGSPVGEDTADAAP